MDRQNNFRKLMEEEEANCPPLPIQVSHRITGTMKTYRFVGDITDLFMPKIFGTMLGMMGGQGTAAHDNELPPDLQSNNKNPHNRG